MSLKEDLRDAERDLTEAQNELTELKAKQEEAKAAEGRKIYGRNRACVGKVRRVSYRQCAVCGWHSCYIVDWGEGTSRKMTKPCTCGVKENPDGTLEII